MGDLSQGIVDATIARVTKEITAQVTRDVTAQVTKDVTAKKDEEYKQSLKDIFLGRITVEEAIKKLEETDEEQKMK